MTPMLSGGPVNCIHCATNIRDYHFIPTRSQRSYTTTNTGPDLNPVYQTPVRRLEGSMAHNSAGTWPNPHSDQTRTGLNPMAQSWTGPTTGPNQALSSQASLPRSQPRGDISYPWNKTVSAGTLHRNVGSAANPQNHRTQNLPGSTLRPSSPGYVSKEMVDKLTREVSEPTRSLFARGLVSQEVATEQWMRENSGQNQTVTSPMTSRNPRAWANEMTEREKLAERERRAGFPTDCQIGPGPVSPTSTRVWVNPENVEHERHGAAYGGGNQDVPGESRLHSKTWVNPEYSERDNWATTQQGLKKMNLDRSPFVPHTYGEYLNHRTGITEAAAREETRKLKLKQAEREGPQVRIRPAMMGKTFDDNRGTVTAMETIWTPNYKPTQAHPQAKWPIAAEMKEEGDERYTSGFGRFPALPRVPGNETVGHKMRSVVNSYYIDRVSALPQPALENDVPEPVDEAEMRWLLGGLAEHIEEFGDDPKPEGEAQGKEKEKEF